MLLYHRVWHHNKKKTWKSGCIPPGRPRWPFDAETHFLSLSLHPSRSPSERLPRARLATDELKVCQLAGWEERRERHQKEFIQQVFFPIPPLCSLLWVFEGFLGSSSRPFIYTLTDYPLHELLNLDLVSFYFKNINYEYSWSLLLRECWERVLF